jgi:hypothetical protein
MYEVADGIHLVCCMMSSKGWQSLVKGVQICMQDDEHTSGCAQAVRARARTRTGLAIL